MKSMVMKALHPRWRGALQFSHGSPNTVRHLKGTAAGARVVKHGVWSTVDVGFNVQWEDGTEDIFRRHPYGVLIQKECNIISEEELIGFRLSKNDVVYPTKLMVPVGGCGYEVGIRLHTSDISTYRQVFTKCEYLIPDLPSSARCVFDLGANVGFASVYFSLKYPDALVVGVEPDRENFEALTSNVSRLGGRVLPVHGAVWSEDKQIRMVSENQDGLPLGSWGMQVSDSFAIDGADVSAYSMQSLMEKAHTSEIDILKVDIEGAELELFSENSTSWLGRVNFIIVETHDRFRPGSEKAVRDALIEDFVELPRRGENLIFRHK